MMDKLLSTAERCHYIIKFTKAVSVLDAVRWISPSWKSVEKPTITKCFARCW